MDDPSLYSLLLAEVHSGTYAVHAAEAQTTTEPRIRPRYRRRVQPLDPVAAQREANELLRRGNIFDVLMEERANRSRYRGNGMTQG